MITPDEFDVLPNRIVKLYQEFEDSVIRDIARRLAKLDMSATAAWQAQRLSESGLLYSEILKQLSALTGRSEAELARLFQEAGVRAIAFDDGIYKAAGLDPLPLNLSPQMGAILRLSIQRTGGTMRNLTQTLAYVSQQQFLDAADLAFLQVTSGTFSYDDAIRQAVKSVGSSGIKVLYPSGHRDMLDVAMRRTVLTGVSQLSGDLQWARADEMNQDLVQTSAHAGARPTHVPWQGQVFSRSGTDPDYPPFKESTGYGTGGGLGGPNCRHSYYPYIKGISENAYDEATRNELAKQTVTYQDQEVSAYAALQKQREMERQVRKYKREASALEAAGLDNAPELALVRQWQARLRDLVRQTGLDRQYAREQI